MAEHSAIQWTDATVNFWWGCSRVGPGCDHCYADTWAKRLGLDLWDGTERKKIAGAVPLIRKLNRTAGRWHAVHGRRQRVFIQSMSDIMDKDADVEWLREAWTEIKAADALELQIVTKRISIIEKRLAAIGETGWPQHAGLIISIVNQVEADRDIPRLIELKKKLGIPWVGLSLEPLLGAVVLKPEWLVHIDWVIVGGESGTDARPMHPAWARSLRDQCAAVGVAFLFKQWGEWHPADAEDHPQDCRAADKSGLILAMKIDGSTDSTWRAAYWAIHPGEQGLCRIGKKQAGRLLDGLQHDGFPEVSC